jgi:hypothetical protein
MSDAPLTDCPQCGAPAFKKQLTAAGFQLKGSGWYVTDFRGGGGATAVPPVSGSEAPAPAAGDSKPAESAATPAAAPAAAAPASPAGGSATPPKAS